MKIVRIAVLHFFVQTFYGRSARMSAFNVIGVKFALIFKGRTVTELPISSGAVRAVMPQGGQRGWRGGKCGLNLVECSR